MKINGFRIFLIIIISIIGLTLIILGIIYLIRHIKKKRKEKKTEQQEMSVSSTNETSQPSNNLSSSQGIFPIHKNKELQLREVKINAFCECFLKPVKYDLIKIYNDTCAIDLVKFNEDNLISVTKCNHGFHYNCIKKYLLENEINKELKCPICLSVLFTFDDNIP